MIVDGRQTFMSIFDKRCWNRTIVSADLPAHHVMTSLAVLNHNRLAVSYFGEKSELKIYDMRMNAWSSGVSIFNKSYKSIGFSISPDKSVIGCINQCGTLRMYKSNSLEPIIDYQCGKVHADEHYIPQCWFTNTFVYYTKYTMQDKSLTILRCPY